MSDIRLEEALVAAATLFSADTVAETRFKLRAYTALLSIDIGDPDDGTIDVFEVLDAVEKYAGYWSEDRIRHLVQTLGLLESVKDQDDLYEIKREIKLEDVSQELIKGKATKINSDFIDQIRENKATDPLITIFEIQSVVKLAYDNFPRYFDLSGLPLPAPFMQRIEDGSLEPFTANRSITAAFDQLGLAIEVPDLLAGLSDPEKSQCTDEIFETIAKVMKGMQITDDPYGDDGGIHLNGKDEDYPGGDRPAVPSNAIALIGISLKMLSGTAQTQFHDVSSGLTDFLLHHQQETGLWGVYSYDSPKFSGRFQSDSHIFFSSLTVTALHLYLLATGEDLRVTESIRQCAHAVMGATDAEGNSISSRGLRTKSGSAASTAYAINILLTADSHFSETDRERARFCILEFGEWVSEHWKVSDETSVDEIRFRPPTINGPAGTFMTWEQPAHAQILSSLSTAATKGLLPLDQKLSRKLHLAASKIALSAQDGFWMDFGMTDKIQVSNSATCTMALVKFLKLQQQSLSSE